ncbi:PEP-CTERM sorting domain-containing protein [Niveibacterium microcysteis]|uniref:PEP-CTERM sorting domain-containing protein n=1 Tax=Niveibacterium microcysteis TaxID=2811415 RepID=A0ABX7MA65_9RHOO|nr:PEP-CTERM sorting domain-containing protein [Niveibacterium microcysteis]QSI78608.1 PEP-CTERM sorting domain-containing protein [Niveibacterium microcysteis]
MIRTLATTALLALTPTLCLATPITPSDGWQTFYFGDAGSAWLDAPAFDDAALPTRFEFTLDGPARLDVTDLGLAGDRFEVVVNGVRLGLTSAMPINDTDVGLDFDTAFTSPAWSHGSWTLAAGTYTVSGLASDSPFGAGVGAIRLAAVPEPATIALLSAGCCLLGLRRRSR